MAAEKFYFARFGEGYEFHSCRNCLPINSGFQPLGECRPAKQPLPQPIKTSLPPIASATYTKAGPKTRLCKPSNGFTYTCASAGSTP